MDITDLRAIGRTLLERVPAYRFADNVREVLEVGAAGDTTFPMDKVAEDIVLSALESLGEPLLIVSEECGVKEVHGSSSLRLLVDPIDGSKNAISGVPFFSTSLAAAQGDRIGDIFLAYVVNLTTKDEFWAKKGEGAFFNGRKMETSRSGSIETVFFEAQQPARDLAALMPLFALSSRARCFGSMALSLCYMAGGAASAFVAPCQSRSFDFAAGLLIAAEAGAVITDIQGNDISACQTGLQRVTTLLIAANRDIHRKALAALGSQ